MNKPFDSAIFPATLIILLSVRVAVVSDPLFTVILLNAEVEEPFIVVDAAPVKFIVEVAEVNVPLFVQSPDRL